MNKPGLLKISKTKKGFLTGTSQIQGHRKEVDVYPKCGDLDYNPLLRVYPPLDSLETTLPPPHSRDQSQKKLQIIIWQSSSIPLIKSILPLRHTLISCTDSNTTKPKQLYKTRMEKKTNFSMIQNASHELVLEFLHEDKNTVCILGWKLLLFEDWANQKKKGSKEKMHKPVTDG